MLIVRLLSNGQLDETFGDQGKVIKTLFGQDESVRSIALQSDGRIVIVGSAYEVGYNRLHMVVMRLLANGEMDLTFNGTGFRLFDQGGFSGRASLIQADGKVIAVGGNGGDIVMLRLDSDGSSDATFGSNGRYVFRLGNNQVNFVEDATLQADGKILLSGSVQSTSGSTTRLMAVARVNVNGVLDATFNGTGWAGISFGGNSWNYANAVALDSSGTVVIGGSTRLSNGYGADYAVARFLSDGTLDTSFDEDGKVVINIEEAAGGSRSEDIATDLSISGGKIVVAGSSTLSFAFQSLARLNTNGTLDSTFDNDGKLRLNSPDECGAPVKIEVLSDERILVAGRLGITQGSIQVVRLNVDGTYDESFDENGTLQLRLGRSLDTMSALALQPDGKILASGTISTRIGLCVVAVRYLENGNLDKGFGVAGIGKLCFYSDGPIVNMANPVVSGIVLNTNGKFVVSGTINRQVNGFFVRDFFMLGFTASGSIDVDFGNAGLVETDIEGGHSDLSYASTIQPDGRIIMVGGIRVNPWERFAVARFLPNGDLDTTFGGDGKIAIDLPLASNQSARDVQVNKDGKITIIGESASDWLVALRLNADGSLDPSFNGTGFMHLYNHAGQAFQIDEKDRITIATRPRSPQTGSDFGIVRINYDGSLDSTFGIEGTVTMDIEDAQLANDIQLQSNGRIVVTGSAGANFGSKFLTVRFESNGSLDESFGSSGTVVTDVAVDQYDGTSAVRIQPDGNILLGGSADTPGLPTLTDFALVRLIGDKTQTPVGRTPFDFDGDGKTDVSVFRPSGGSGGGEWWYLRSSDGGNGAFAFGANTDTPVPADFTGDGKTDVAFWRPSTGEWYVIRSEDSTFFAFPFGSTGDVPMPGDFDGDGEADATVFRPSANIWFTRRSSDGQVTTTPFGAAGDKPVAADFDGDGRTDIAIYRPNGASGGGEWWYQRSSDGGNRAFAFGSATDKAVPADFTGDGKADLAFWRPSTGEWYVVRSEDDTFFAFPFGVSTDIPVPGDYDGDGKADAAIFRPSENIWYLLRSTAGFQAVAFGAAGDQPLPNVYVR